MMKTLTQALTHSQELWNNIGCQKCYEA